jgi:hypothetical protein
VPDTPAGMTVVRVFEGRTKHKFYASVDELPDDIELSN